MEKNYQMTQELRESISNFLINYMKYGECLSKLNETDKKEFTEEEINSVLNLLGALPLKDVFHLVEKFKIEVAEVKNDPSGENTGG
jgi:microsomal dipeptidase-like Zn-dependent dipeptidase